ncbi:MAG: hypothetical protein HQK51_08480 [Oligoflexia bacterium]|nr:hypothetical protein [Oligoflexia bacterium]
MFNSNIFFKKLLLLLFHLLLLFVYLTTIAAVTISPLYAFIKFSDAAFPEIITSGRGLAMGNAFICKVDDSSSVFYNPAGLGSVRKGHFHLTNIHLETNKDLINASSSGGASDVASNATKGFSYDGTRQLLLENRGKIVYNRVHFMPNLTLRFVSIGYAYSLQRRATLGLEEDAKFELASREDYGPYGALNLSLFGGVFKFGVTGMYLGRNELYVEQDPNTSVETEDSSYYKGSMFLIIVGGKITLPISFLPTIAVKKNNVSNKEFKGRAAGEPAKMKDALDVGFSLTPQIGKYIRIHMEADYKDATNKHSDVSSSRKLMAGLEFDFGRLMFLRFGYGDGFGSGGIGLKTKKLEFDLTTYAVDATTNEFRGKEDRHFSMTISSGI